MRALAFLFEPARLRRLATIWLLVAAAGLAAHLALQTRAGLTDGAGHPFGDDAITAWAGGRLALLGRARDIYDFARFHQFQVGATGHDFQLYHYSYPPILPLLTIPLGALPFLAAWAAWLGLGWAAFALCLRTMMPANWALYAAALPAVFINAISGQNGPWTAAIIGWGLVLLRTRPLLAGAVLSLIASKPQLGLLIPVALLAGLHARALAAFLAGCAAQAAASILAFGPAIWTDYLARAQILKRLVLEDGTGVWHRMISVFVLCRHLGATVQAAYAIQAAASIAIAAAIAWTWWRPTPYPAKCAALVLGMLLASPYVSDYDLVMAGFVPLWLLSLNPAGIAWSRAASVLLIAAPVAAAPLALRTGIAGAGLMLLPALALALRAPAQAAALSGRTSRAAGALSRPTSVSK